MNIDGQGGLKNIKEDREETGMNLIVVVKSFLCLFFYCCDRYEKENYYSM